MFAVKNGDFPIRSTEIIEDPKINFLQGSALLFESHILKIFYSI